MRLGLGLFVAAVLALTLTVSVTASASPAGSSSASAVAAGKKKKKKKKKSKVLTVCKHGCKYRTIQKAVNKAGKKWTVKVKPGKYVEGVRVYGHKYDGLRIVGTGKKPTDVVIEGTNAQGPGGLAQHGIEGKGVNNLKVENMKVENFASNGVFIHGEEGGCNGYLMKNMVAADNRSYGLFALNCIGGRITQSTGYGQGDSAFYIGETPPQDDPVRTELDHLDGHLNVLGYSGTNSKYVDIHDSAFYNNGAGVLPNTLDSEKFEPNSDGTIKNNDIFWNNFNYYLPDSPVQTVSGGLGCIDPPNNTICLNYPAGIGVILFGSQGWTVEDNNIFGNFLWGSAAFSDPFNSGDDAISRDNQFINNTNGRGGTDINAVDFFADGSGSGNCWSGNTSSTFDLSSTAGLTDAELYPTCPAPAAPNDGASNTSAGDPIQVFVDLVGVVSADPAEDMQCAWTEHSHPAFESYTPFEVSPGPTC